MNKNDKVVITKPGRFEGVEGVISKIRYTVNINGLEWTFDENEVKLHGAKDIAPQVTKITRTEDKPAKQPKVAKPQREVKQKRAYVRKQK